MNKYLVLMVAAFLGGATSVDAKTYCFVFASYGGDFCDAGRISTGVDSGILSGAARAWVHTNNNCSGGTSQGYGFLSRTPGLGKASLMSDNYLARNYGLFSTTLSWIFPKRIKNNAPCSAWVGMNGTTFFYGGSGFLINVNNCQNASKTRGGKSTLDGLRELIRMHRNARQQSGPDASGR